MLEFIPKVDNTFVAPEYYEDLKTILESRMFFPLMLTGPTGVGKTYVIEQACARLNIPLLRINLTFDTDESALMGGFRLHNDNGVSVTEFEEGPIIKGMRNGAVVLLDEMDLGTPQALQSIMSVLEGNGYLIKHTNEYVRPNNGFNIIATANTKGTGDDTGKYVSTNILNEAFLERFIGAVDVSYLSNEKETEILKNNMKFFNKSNDEFVNRLVEWASQIREAAKKTNEFTHDMTTRRLCHIVRTYALFGDEEKAVDFCLSRFDEYHKKAFKNFYDALDPKVKGQQSSTTGKIFPDDIIAQINKLGKF